ncbi:hypothetical protein HK101_008911 [Irineochytrium annulatum]|nr:hypothetical protein HK101_008911 [Irineochytrium annulatum]
MALTDADSDNGISLNLTSLMLDTGCGLDTSIKGRTDWIASGPVDAAAMEAATEMELVETEQYVSVIEVRPQRSGTG